MLMIFTVLACKGAMDPHPEDEISVAATTEQSSSGTTDLQADCKGAKNTCPSYASSWKSICPPGSRCISFKNSCDEPVVLAYQIGCNGDGTKGAPQCDCTSGPRLHPGSSMFFEISDGDYNSCLPSWKPPCLTAGLAVLANSWNSSCTTGTRIEFTAGNSADMYGKFDSYDIDVEKSYAVPVSFSPGISCARDHANHDCRPLYCNSADCPDAYGTPTSGGCPDGRSPQASCQDTFWRPAGYTVEYCPSDCATTGGACPSCLDAISCPPGE